MTDTTKRVKSVGNAVEQLFGGSDKAATAVGAKAAKRTDYSKATGRGTGQGFESSQSSADAGASAAEAATDSKVAAAKSPSLSKPASPKAGAAAGLGAAASAGAGAGAGKASPAAPSPVAGFNPAASQPSQTTSPSQVTAPSDPEKPVSAETPNNTGEGDTDAEYERKRAKLESESPREKPKTASQGGSGGGAAPSQPLSRPASAASRSGEVGLPYERDEVSLPYEPYNPSTSSDSSRTLEEILGFGLGLPLAGAALAFGVKQLQEKKEREAKESRDISARSPIYASLVQYNPNDEFSADSSLLVHSAPHNDDDYYDYLPQSPVSFVAQQRPLPISQKPGISPTDSALGSGDEGNSSSPSHTERPRFDSALVPARLNSLPPVSPAFRWHIASSYLPLVTSSMALPRNPSTSQALVQNTSQQALDPLKALTQLQSYVSSVTQCNDQTISIFMQGLNFLLQYEDSLSKQLEPGSVELLKNMYFAFTVQGGPSSSRIVASQTVFESHARIWLPRFCNIKQKFLAQTQVSVRPPNSIIIQLVSEAPSSNSSTTSRGSLPSSRSNSTAPHSRSRSSLQSSLEAAGEPSSSPVASRKRRKVRVAIVPVYYPKNPATYLSDLMKSFIELVSDMKVDYQQSVDSKVQVSSAAPPNPLDKQKLDFSSALNKRLEEIVKNLLEFQLTLGDEENNKALAFQAKANHSNLGYLINRLALELHEQQLDVNNNLILNGLLGEKLKQAIYFISRFPTLFPFQSQGSADSASAAGFSSRPAVSFVSVDPGPERAALKEIVYEPLVLIMCINPQFANQLRLYDICPEEYNTPPLNRSEAQFLLFFIRKLGYDILQFLNFYPATVQSAAVEKKVNFITELQQGQGYEDFFELLISIAEASLKLNVLLEQDKCPSFVLNTSIQDCLSALKCETQAVSETNTTHCIISDFKLVDLKKKLYESFKLTSEKPDGLKKRLERTKTNPQNQFDSVVKLKVDFIGNFMLPLLDNIKNSKADSVDCFNLIKTQLESLLFELRKHNLYSFVNTQQFKTDLQNTIAAAMVALGLL